MQRNGPQTRYMTRRLIVIMKLSDKLQVGSSIILKMSSRNRWQARKHEFMLNPVTVTATPYREYFLKNLIVSKHVKNPKLDRQ